ncbi:unnamed protein product [Boreogadus saida]
MPAVGLTIVAPEEVLRPNARCPRPQCRITDDLLTKCYDTAAHMGHIGNSLSNLILALSQSLQSSSCYVGKGWIAWLIRGGGGDALCTPVERAMKPAEYKAALLSALIKQQILSLPTFQVLPEDDVPLFGGAGDGRESSGDADSKLGSVGLDPRGGAISRTGGMSSLGVLWAQGLKKDLELGDSVFGAMSDDGLTMLSEGQKTGTPAPPCRVSCRPNGDNS